MGAWIALLFVDSMGMLTMRVICTFSDEREERMAQLVGPGYGFSSF